MTPRPGSKKRLEAVEALEAARVAAGTCRHCGGPVPCWSPFGDRAVGKRHTAASLQEGARRVEARRPRRPAVSVMLRLSRSDTFCAHWRIPHGTPDHVERGPFEYVEFTYDGFRVGPDGDGIGAYREGAWWLDESPHPFSDIVIYGKDSSCV